MQDHSSVKTRQVPFDPVKAGGREWALKDQTAEKKCMYEVLKLSQFWQIYKNVCKHQIMLSY